MSMFDELKRDIMKMDSVEMELLLGFLEALVNGEDTEIWWQLAREMKNA